MFPSGWDFCRDENDSINPLLRERSLFKKEALKDAACLGSTEDHTPKERGQQKENEFFNASPSQFPGHFFQKKNSY
jgi:hypothetical protein